VERVLLSAPASLLSYHVQDGTLEAILKGNRFSYNFTNQSGYEPLNLENGSSVNNDNFGATDLRF